MSTIYYIPALLLMTTLTAPAWSQQKTAEEQFDSAYAKRIGMEEINGVYIPENLGDAFAELQRLTSPADIEKFKGLEEMVARDKLHFSLGRWMIHNWGFYEGSRMSHYLKTRGLEHPDDMAKVLLVSFHRHLNSRPLEVDLQIAEFQAMREEERRLREQSKTLIHEETRVRKKNN